MMNNARRDRKTIRTRIVRLLRTRPTSSIADAPMGDDAIIRPKATAFQKKWRLALMA
jgi:hypothetical protein